MYPQPPHRVKIYSYLSTKIDFCQNSIDCFIAQGYLSSKKKHLDNKSKRGQAPLRPNFKQRSVNYGKMIRIKQQTYINDTRWLSELYIFDLSISTMDSPIKLEPVEMSIPIKKTPQKREKVGRWSSAESYLFESLLQRYGKNWKKIHEHMKNRSLSQIRSHAQKFFDKVGPKKVEEFQRRAKLLEAYETLEKEKRIREGGEITENSEEIKDDQLVKQEEESPLTVEEEKKVNEDEKESLVKEQEGKSETQLVNEQKINEQKDFFPFLQSYNGTNCSFLMQFLSQNPQAFYQYQGIQPFIDNVAFNTFLPGRAN